MQSSSKPQVPSLLETQSSRQGHIRFVRIQIASRSGEISSDSKGFSAFLSTEPLAPTAANQKPEVTFQKYGTTLVLKEIWVPGLSTGFSVQTSYAEKKAAKAGSPTKVSVGAAKK